MQHMILEGNHPDTPDNTAQMQHDGSSSSSSSGAEALMSYAQSSMVPSAPQLTLPCTYAETMLMQSPLGFPSTRRWPRLVLMQQLLCRVDQLRGQSDALLWITQQHYSYCCGDKPDFDSPPPCIVHKNLALNTRVFALDPDHLASGHLLAEGSA
jgi:hypothetical protein